MADPDRNAAIWLVAAVAAATAPHVLNLPPWLAGFAALALAGRLALHFGRRPLPRRGLVRVAALVLVVGIAVEHRTLLGRDAGVALLAGLATLKLLEGDTRRDALAVVLLADFLLLTQYFYSQTIPTGLWLVAATVMVTAATVRLHAGTTLPARAVFAEAGRLVALAVPFMLALYLLFPRLPGPLWGLPQDAYAGLTGLSDTMSPGSLDELIESGAIAFRARFDGRPPRQDQLYWRGPAFDRYDGRTWRASAAAPQAPEVAAIGPEVAYTLTLEPHNRRWLLALDLPTLLPPDAQLAPSLEALAGQPVRARQVFAFRSAPAYRANPSESPATLRKAVQLPPGNPKARALGRSWQDQGLSPAAIVARALDGFRSEPFAYTLRPPRLGADAVDEFLFTTRRGFCEHYAGAFVFLMRTAGVPARVVTGYQGGEFNPVDGTIVVRQSDAHAWAEVWISGEGWQRVDPTAAVAPSRIETGIGSALPAGDPLPLLMRGGFDWLRPLRHRWEAINNTWNLWVLGYNPQRQREVLAELGLPDPDWRTMGAALAAVGATLMLTVAAWTLGRWTRPDPATRLWRRLARRLAAYGLRQAASEGPLDFAARIGRERPELAAPVARSAELYAAARYGPRADPKTLAELRTEIRRLPRSWRMH